MIDLYLQEPISFFFLLFPWLSLSISLFWTLLDVRITNSRLKFILFLFLFLFSC